MALFRFYRLPAAAVAVMLLTSCATFTQKELQTLSQRGVPASLVARLDERRPLTPPELISLTQNGVPAKYLGRHLESRGIDYVVTRADVLRLRRAGVAAVVIDALLRESDLFSAGYAARESVYYHSAGYHDPWLDDGFGVGVGVSHF